MKKTRPLPFRPSALYLALAACSFAHAETDSETFTASLPTIEVEATADGSITKGYIDYDEAQVSRNNLQTKEIPQTIDILNIQKNKNYGTNDLSSILEGNAGIDATYDMRGESIYLRGFAADANDIYRDGIRESGQVRRSTANIERVEILKGPASVLYGRSAGGGIINMVSKYANFNTNRNIGLAYGSWANRSLNMDINQAVNDNVAVRLNGEWGEADAWRHGVESKNRMISPSISLRNDDRTLLWTGQYTYDSAWRVPDRNPSRRQYELMGINQRTGFARPGDFVEDKLQVWRSELQYQFADNWRLNWQLAHRRADQDFDHYYGGTFDETSRMLRQAYAWQQTSNRTFTNNLSVNGEFHTGPIGHKLTVGLDYSKERRDPTLATLRNQEIDPYDPASWQHISPRPDATIANRHRSTNSGLFVQDLISLTPNVKVMLGGRYSRFKFHSTDINQQSSGYNGHAFSPNAGIAWDVTPDHTLYASYSKSFSPYGGSSYLGVTASADSDTFNMSPEVSKQWEAGIKSSWLDQRLNTTLALYQLEHGNIRYRPDPNDLTLWAVRGKERSRGIELSTIGQIVPNWYLRSSLGWMSAKVVEDKSNPQNEGQHLNNTGNFSGNIFVRYAPDNRFYGEVGVTKLGKRYYRTTQGVSEPIPGFTRVDAMLGWNPKPFNLTFAVSNLFNKTYWRSDSMPGNPRAYTLRLNYQF